MIQIAQGDFGYNLVMEVTDNESTFNLNDATAITFRATNINRASDVVEGEATEENDQFLYALQQGDFDSKGMYAIDLLFVITEGEESDQVITQQLTVPCGVLKVV
jgi:hypothetical protein